MRTLHLANCAAVIDRAAEEIGQAGNWEGRLSTLVGEIGGACEAVEVALFRTRYSEKTVLLTNQADTWSAGNSSATDPLMDLVFRYVELNELLEGHPIVVTGVNRPVSPAGFWLGSDDSAIVLPIRANKTLWGMFRLVFAGEAARPDETMLNGLQATVDRLGRAVEIVENAREEQLYQSASARLQQVGSQTEQSADERVDAILRLMLEVLELDIAIVSHIEGDRYTVKHFAPVESGLSVGQVFDLGVTYCSITVSYNRVVDIPYMELSEFNRHPCYTAFKLESYIGAVLQMGGERYGTLNFSSAKPRPPFTQGQRRLMQDATRMVQTLIERG